MSNSAKTMCTMCRHLAYHQCRHIAWMQRRSLARVVAFTPVLPSLERTPGDSIQQNGARAGK